MFLGKSRALGPCPFSFLPVRIQRSVDCMKIVFSWLCNYFKHYNGNSGGRSGIGHGILWNLAFHLKFRGRTIVYQSDSLRNNIFEKVTASPYTIAGVWYVWGGCIRCTAVQVIIIQTQFWIVSFDIELKDTHLRPDANVSVHITVDTSHGRAAMCTTLLSSLSERSFQCTVALAHVWSINSFRWWEQSKMSH